MNSPGAGQTRTAAASGSQRRGGHPRSPVGVRPLGCQPPGHPRPARTRTARFDGISQPWLRNPVKRWSRFRLATGCAFTTINSGALALTRFSRFLATRHPQAADASAITRPVLEDYLSWLLTQGYSASTRALSLSMIRVLFDACHRHGWLPGLAASATIYVEELPFHHDEIARFIPEFVMAQLESDEALSKIPHTTTRNLVAVMIETGLRGGDACNLPFSPVLTDSSGWPCLRFEAAQGPLRAADPAQRQGRGGDQRPADPVREHSRAGSPWLFPGIAGNDDGIKPYSHSSFTRQLIHWQRVIDLHDEVGQPVTVTGHQFRHTLGTLRTGLAIHADGTINASALVPGGQFRTHRDHDDCINGREGPGDQGGHHGLADHDIQVVQPVLQNRDRHRGRHHHNGGEHRARGDPAGVRGFSTGPPPAPGPRPPGTRSRPAT